MLRFVVPFLSLLLAATAVAAQSSQATQLVLEPTVFVTHAGDSVGAEFGLLSVPLRHEDHDGPWIQLAFVRFPSTATNPGYPIVYLAGGPGGSGIELARGRRFALFQALRAYGDVIALDQRGAGLSVPSLTCPEPVRFAATPALTRESVLHAFQAAGSRCATHWRNESVDLQAFNTEESADDLEDLRTVLHADKLRLVGMSYGSHLALAAVRRHGAGIDRAVLAGVEGPDQSLKSPADLEKQLQTVARLIAADPVAGPRLPDFHGALAAILEQLKLSPAVEAIQVDTGDGPRTVTVAIGPYEVKALAAEMLSGRASIEQIPTVFLPMLDGDFSVAAQVMGGARLVAPLSAMGSAMDCSSGASDERRASTGSEARQTLLGDVMDFPFPVYCDAWDVRSLPETFRSRIRSDVPVLFVSGSLDGRTPPGNVTALMPGFSRGSHLIVDNVGHEDDLLVGSEEILRAIGTFIGGGASGPAHLELPAPVFSVPRSQGAPRRALAIRDVTLIDGTRAAARPGMTVMIQAGTITSVAPTVSNDGAGADVVDGSGHWLIPGLWDMHVHLSKIGPSALPLLLANGVTGVRDMGGDFAEVQQWRREISAGSRIGPRIFTAGPMLESPENVDRMIASHVLEPVERTRVRVANPERAASIVDSLAALGVDFIKVRTFGSTEIYRALGAAARRNDLRLVGHAVGLSPADLLAAMPASIEHYLYPTLEDMTSEQRIEFFRQLAQAGTAMVPTMVNAFNSTLVPDAQVTAVVSETGASVDARRRYLSARLLADWREQAAERGPEGPAQLQALLPALSRNMFEMRQAGMLFLPGTDAAVVMIYPGFSYHDELQLMQDKLEMTPMEILMSATSRSAGFLGAGDKVGTIATGKLADLVLLDANPLDEIGATKRIAAVVSGGSLYDRASLDRILESVAVSAPEDRLPGGSN